MTETKSSTDYLRDQISRTPIHRLALELEQINTVKLKDSDILDSRELRDYYIQRQGLIIAHLRDALEKGKTE
jgi:hypothetical protein